MRGTLRPAVPICVQQLNRAPPSQLAPWRSFTAGRAEGELDAFAAELRRHGGGEVRLELSSLDTTTVATITLDNPKKANALSGKMMVELNDAVRQLEEETTAGLHKPLTTVLLRAAGQRAFCAGADLQLAAGFLASSERGLLMHDWMAGTCGSSSALEPRLLSLVSFLSFFLAVFRSSFARVLCAIPAWDCAMSFGRSEQWQGFDHCLRSASP